MSEHIQLLSTKLPRTRMIEAKLAVLGLDIPMLRMLDFPYPCLRLPMSDTLGDLWTYEKPLKSVDLYFWLDLLLPKREIIICKFGCNMICKIVGSTRAGVCRTSDHWN